MSRDVSNLQSGEEAKFNAHIAMLERINQLQVEADKYSCIPNGDAQLLWYNCVRCIERIMWNYITDKEKTYLNSLRPPAFSSSTKNPISGKSVSTYDLNLSQSIGNWEIAVNSMIAHRGLALKSGKNPSSAIID